MSCVIHCNATNTGSRSVAEWICNLSTRSERPASYPQGDGRRHVSHWVGGSVSLRAGLYAVENRKISWKKTLNSVLPFRGNIPHPFSGQNCKLNNPLAELYSFCSVAALLVQILLLLLLLLLLFNWIANGFLPGGSGTTLRHITQNITPRSNKTQHTKLHKQNCWSLWPEEWIVSDLMQCPAVNDSNLRLALLRGRSVTQVSRSGVFWTRCLFFLWLSTSAPCLLLRN
jgi:hypothetical protein